MVKIKRLRLGFTIIEVMIVLAVIALIMLIITEGLSEVRKSYRDHIRRNYVTDVLAATEEFYKNNKRLPFCTDTYTVTCPTADSDAAKFISNYLPNGNDPLTGKSWRDSSTKVGGISGEDADGNLITFCDPAVSNMSDSAVYCAADRATRIAHKIYPEVGQLFIVENHMCCPCEVGPEFTSTVEGDTINHGFVPGRKPDGTWPPDVWDLPDTLSILIGTERGDFFCVDNHGKR
jgi:prepilin-type N-terminal cleavage/methylation domain-containing protein